ncbi:acetate--CoA ligase family protein [Pseudodesulfovibrio sp.]|uniref:acetate--CoA ligase family protein n=1 Tax=unclassified Pseudodesulfovibrio TaxID=2661612 RepID=UPI003B00F21F
MTDKDKLHAFFHPETVAVVGASATPGKVGHTVLANMREAGYRGRLFPVNPKGGTIEGLPVIPSVAELPHSLDLAVVAVPREGVPDVLRQLLTIGCKSAIVVTSGFKEAGREGYRLEIEIAELCEQSGMALLGPNCLGMINTSAGINASFAAGRPAKGSIAFFSQSGALCVAVLDWALAANVGFSKFISLGNEAGLDETDMLRYLNEDPETKVILGYIENVQDGEAFLAQARAASLSKPVIMIKSGTTTAGAKAASAHTGAIVGVDQAYTAAFHQAGVIRVDGLASLFNLARAFSCQPLPKGPNLAVVTNSGGPGILTADATDRSHLAMAELSSRTVQRLQEFLPSYAAFYNPVDIVGDADAQRYRQTLDVVADDPMVHSLLVLLTPTAGIEPEEVAEAVIHTAERCGKPVFACFMGRTRVRAASERLMQAGIPCYAFPEPAVKSIEAMYDFFLWKNRPNPIYAEVERDMDRARKILDLHLRHHEPEIVGYEAREILNAYGLSTPKTKLVRSSEEAVAVAADIGYPVVLKIYSPDIPHKSDVGGVALNLQDGESVAAAFRRMTARSQRERPDAYIVGCLVQKMAPEGTSEVVIGFRRDAQFGPMLMFGLGGIHSEILRDIAFKLGPLSMRDAFEIVREIKSYMLLKGLQGEPAANLTALESVIVTVSQLAMDLPEVWEATFNPVLVNHESVLIADVRMALQIVND